MPPISLFLTLDYNDEVIIRCLIVPLPKTAYVESATVNSDAKWATLERPIPCLVYYTLILTYDEP